MTERFVLTGGTISVANGASTVTGTGTLFAGHDRAGAELWAHPHAGQGTVGGVAATDTTAFLVGTIAEVTPRGVYDNLSLPLVTPYRGPALVNVNYELVDGPAIANGATQAAVFSRYAAFLEQNAGLTFSSDNVLDMSLVPNNSIFVDVGAGTLEQWHNGVMEPVGIAVTGVLNINTTDPGTTVTGPRSINHLAGEYHSVTLPAGLTGGDNADDGNWQQAVNLFRADYTVNTGASGESICAGTFHLRHHSATSTGDLVGGVLVAYSKASNLGGYGNLYGGASSVIADTGAGWVGIVGLEAAASIHGTAVVHNRTAVNALNSGPHRAIDGVDTAYGMTSGTAGGEFKTGITNYNGLMAGGTFFESTFDASIADLFNLSNVEVTGSLIDSSFVRLTGDGNLALGTSLAAWDADRNVSQVNHSALQGVNTGTTILSSNYSVDSLGTPRYLGATGAGAWIVGADGSWQFANAPAGTIGNPATFTTRLIGDINGNVGLGTLSAWNTDRKALQLDKSSIQGVNTGTLVLGSGYYVDGSGVPRYLGGTGAGALIVGADGSFNFASAPAGTTGNSITFALRALSLAGNFTTSGAYNLTATLTGDTNVTFPTSGTLATQAYAQALFASNDALLYKGALDCSGSPNYPAADAGHVYKVSVAGKIGGASGINVQVGDSLLCTVDGSAAGTQAAVGANWDIVQANLDGAVIGPASSTSGNLASFSGTGGTLIQDAGVAVDTDGTLAANSDAKLATQKAVKTFASNVSNVTSGTLGAARLPAFGSGDVSFAAGGGASTIANDAVTYAKMQNVSATSRFIGRKTAGAGDPEELSAADAKTILALSSADLSDSVAPTAWTPSFVGSTTPGTGQTYNIQVGSYTKSGSRVIASLHLSASSLGTAAGDLQISASGLPTPSSTTNDFGGGFISYFSVAGLAAGANDLSVVASAVGSNTWNLWQNGNIGKSKLTVAQAGDGVYLIGTIIFHV